MGIMAQIQDADRLSATPDQAAVERLFAGFIVDAWRVGNSGEATAAVEIVTKAREDWRARVAAKGGQ